MMTADEPPLVSARWPHLAAELVTALRGEGENDLAGRVDDAIMYVEVLDRPPLS